MHKTDIHDLSDDADYAAASKQGSSSMTRSDSSKRSFSSDSEDSEILYLKDNVTIHPTQFAAERISGQLRLIKQGFSLFMTWIPYKGQSSNARLSERDKNLYTIKAVPFSDIQSIRRHTPTIGWQYVIVVLSSGLAFPPLYFYSGGVREFLATIKQHVLIVRSSEDSNVFLVNNFQDPLQRTLSSLELSRSLANGTHSSSFTGSPSDGNLERDNNVTSENGHSSSIQQNNRQRRKNHDPARDISIQVLEKFSLVTRFARDTTSQLFRESLADGHRPSEKRRNNWASKDNQSQEWVSNDVEIAPKIVPVASDPLEFDKISLIWGKPRQHPLGLDEWSNFLDSEGRVVDPDALKERIFYGGVEHNLRKEVWAFLLEYYSYDSTYAERQYFVSVKKAEYETIKNQWQDKQMEALVEKLCQRFNGVTYARQWENISYCLAQLSFTDKGIKKLIELFKAYEHVLSNEVVMEHFRSIINKGKKFAKPELKSCIDEFEGKISQFHIDKKEQELTARNAAAFQQKADAIKNITLDTTVEEESAKSEAAEDGEVMDPSVDGIPDVPTNECASKPVVEFEESSNASSQVIQSEAPDVEDEVQSPRVIPKGTAKQRAKKSNTTAETAVSHVSSMRVTRSRRR